MIIEKNCKYCGNLFLADTRELNRGNAKYCNLVCAAKNQRKHSPSYKYECLYCNTNFESKSLNVKYCSKKCKTRAYYHASKTVEISIKTINKLLKDIPCEICGWKETTRDNHHIIPVSNGGKNSLDNIISLCPNHHRMVHKNLISEEYLFKILSSRTISSS